MSAQRELPSSWHWAEFGNIATVASNLVNPSLYPNLPHIAPNHIESQTGRLLPWATVAVDGVTSPKHLFYPGQILYSKIRPYLAKAILAPFTGLCSADMYPLETPLNARYLLYWLLSSEFTQYASLVQGRTVLPKINRDQLERLPVPVAPQPEQERIVATVEEQFSCLDAGKAAIERVRQNIRRISAAVLDSPFEAIPFSKWETLASLATIVTGSTPSTANPANYGDYLPFVTPSDFDHGDRVASAGRSLSAIGAQGVRYLPAESVLATCIGATLGKVALATVPCATNQQINAVIPGERLLSEYLFYCLARPSFTKYMWRNSSSTTMPILNKSKFSALKVPVVSIVEQERIVGEVSERMKFIQTLSAEITRVEARIARLRPAILAAAFSGKLVPQVADDEPASALLERIAVERASYHGGRPTRAGRPLSDKVSI